MKPEKNGTTSILSSRYGRWQQNRYRSNRERRGKRKGQAQDAKCVQAQPGGAGEGKAAAPQRADSPRGGAPLPASSLKTYHRYVFLTLRPSQGSIPRHSEKRKAAFVAAFLFWSGRGESNPRIQLGKLMFYH